MCMRTYARRQLAVHITLQTRHDPSQQEAGYWQHTNNHNKGTKDTQTKSVNLYHIIAVQDHRNICQITSRFSSEQGDCISCSSEQGDCIIISGSSEYVSVTVRV
jgi:hypothetical protein